MTTSREVRRADAVIIGTGQAAPALATALAQHGEHVVVFEGGSIGGSCVNVGCTPTKTLRKSARVAHMVARASEFGVHVGDVRVDFAAAMERVESIVSASRAGLTRWMESADGVSIVQEWASFAGREEDGFVLQSDTMKVVAPRVYLNTGTRPRIPSIPGLADAPYLTNESVLALRERPEHLVILGGSYIALEIGQMFRRFGSAVTIIERAERIASREDPEISAEIARFLEAEDVAVRTSTSIDRIEAVPGGVRVQTASTGAVTGSHLLVAIGRTPNTDTLNLDAVGLTTDDRGYIHTDGSLKTAVEGIWAVGDINARGAFTHTSYQDYEIVVDNLTGGSRTADGRIPTYAMFTDPPLGRVGMTEREAKESGRRVLKATLPMHELTRAQLDGETDGLIILLVDADTERFLGGATLGITGDEIIQVVSALMHADARCRVLAEMLPIHPTVAEFFPTILGKLAPLD